MPVAASLNPNSYSGFTDPAVLSGQKKYTDYKLVATKKDLVEGLRYHIMQLSNDKNVDIRDPKQFPHPAHLHRRDPKSVTSAVKDEQAEFKDGMNAEEREQLIEKNEARKAERAANLALIAPTQAARKANNLKTKTKAVYRRDYTEEDKRRIQTNYEEKLPWHLEDFDNKHCFVGENQATSSHRHVAFAYESPADARPGRFRLIPVEKVYEFKPKRKERKEMTIEEAEAAMKRRVHMPEWLEAVERRPIEKKKREMEARSNKLYTGENKSNKFAGRTGEDADWDNDDDGGLFADDEEGDHFAVKDEDEALADKRVREDQLKANFFDVKEEKEYDEEEAEEQKEEEQRKMHSREYRKLLEKHEHNYNHASDSEYSSSSSDEDEEERERLAEEKRKLEAGQLQPTLASGATTPSGRKEKSGIVSDREGKTKRKRPGSPNLSEAGSGTDTSARKKPKMKHLDSARSISRPDTPSGQKPRIRPGAGSDTDAGTMSDSTRRLKLKNSGKPGRASGIPSRTASPAPGSPAALPSRAGAASPPAAPVPMPTLEDVSRVIKDSMPEGLTITEFIGKLAHPKDKRQEIVKLTLGIAKLHTKSDGRKVLVLKDDAQNN